MIKVEGPLKGIRVLDLTAFLFGPLATQTLGDWGADVIKIEPLSGDAWRNSGAFRNRGMSGSFMVANRNKRSLSVDLKSPGGRKVLKRLLPTADVFVTSIRPLALAPLGFGYADCQKINPTMVYAAATGFGQDGPWASRPVYDDIAQAASGLASAIGTDDNPAFVPSLLADKVCGVSLAGAICAALVDRERTGKGQMVEVPMVETLAQFNSVEMMGGHAFVPPIGPAGNKRMKERQPIRTKDGWITMLPFSIPRWTAFFEAVGRPECVEELHIRDAALRIRNYDKIYERLNEIMADRTTADWEQLLIDIDVPHTAFAKISEIEAQPHLQAVGMFVELEHPTEGRIRQARPAVRFSRSKASIHRFAPRTGEHTQEILRENGFTSEEISALAESRSIAVE